MYYPKTISLTTLYLTRAERLKSRSAITSVKKSSRSCDYKHLHALIKLKGLVSDAMIGVVDLIYFCKSLFF